MKNPHAGSVADNLLDEQRTSIQADFDRKHEELRKVSELFKKTIQHLRANNFSSHANLWNVCLHINLIAHDLSVLVEDLAFERNNWKRRLVARHVALVSYEAAEDILGLLGKDFRQALNKIGVLSQFEGELSKAHKPLSLFWKQHQVPLKEIRIKSAAHRDPDAIALLETVENLNIDDILNLGFELGKILIHLGATLQAIIKETSAIAPPEIHET